jgi:mannan endo-1,4-beta-mannosidase
MKQLINLKSLLAKTASLAVLSTLVASQAFAVWNVSGTKVLDPNGNNFIFRGINHAHVWYTDKTTKALTDIAATGANSVRIVLADGDQWTRATGADVTSLISQCKAAKLVCVLEVHDSTGYGEQSAATNISKAAAFWASSEIKTALTGQENYAIINIANEPFGNGISAATYTSDTSAAIKTIRNAGLTHLIMVDGSTWGQDNQYAMRDNAATIFAADSLSRTMFSVHMYEVYNSASVIQNYLTTFQAKGFALIVGEFGTENNGNKVDAASILQYTQQMGIGYIGWSWSGNGSCCQPLDITNSWDPASLSAWGTLLINGSNGIKATSKLATIFTGGVASSVAPASSRPASSVPASSRPASVATVSSTPRSSTPASVAATSSVSGGEQCNWYGTTYPLCVSTTSGWGYENNKSCIARTTCAGQPSPYGIVGGGATSSPASSKPASVAAASSKPASSTPASVAPASSKASSSVAGTGGISCAYVVSNSWNTGFVGAIRVTNSGSSAITGWTATWQYSGNNRMTSAFNATVTGSNPYSATNLAWNGNIAAGQTVEFGFQGTGTGTPEVPNVTCK